MLYLAIIGEITAYDHLFCTAIIIFEFILTVIVIIKYIFLII